VAIPISTAPIAACCKCDLSSYMYVCIMRP
jgi:hypothetical protein